MNSIVAGVDLVDRASEAPFVKSDNTRMVVLTFLYLHEIGWRLHTRESYLLYNHFLSKGD